jgi:aspartate carbamoyltransferase catalytic subunit
MTASAPGIDDLRSRTFPFPFRHFLSAGDLNIVQVSDLLDLADHFVEFNHRASKKLDLLKGRTVMNLFFEPSTRTQSSFEIAAKRLGADTVNMSPRSSSMTKGETLIDTAVTLNAMQPDILIVRHGSSGAAALAGLTVAICGDVAHSRVARSNVAMLSVLGAEVRLVGPPTLIPAGAEHWGVEIHHDMKTGLKGVDVVMMLRLQLERMQGALVPSTREYFRFYGLDRERLSYAASGAKVMHPGPMNRGVEIDSDVADDPAVSLIQNQVEMGVAARMAVLASLAHRLDNS